ncbi:hypothetical protein EKA14_10185 [Bacillus mycoides]|nr:hypothetical protein EKA14_10185 [Bacillus mycoides]
MFVLIPEFLKSPPGFVALVSGLITLVYFIATRFIQVWATDEINKLFIDNVKLINLRVWDFLVAIILFTITFVVYALIFNFSFGEVDITTSGVPKTVYTWSMYLSFFSLFALLILEPFVEKIKKVTGTITIVLFMIFTSITNALLFSFIFNEIIYKKANLENIFITVLLPLLVVITYSFIIPKVHAQTSNVKYHIRMVSEGQIKIENLIHGYVIDEKKTICFPKESTNKDIFYLCDFSSKVYLKYEKETEDNKPITSTTNKNRKRKIYRKRRQ